MQACGSGCSVVEAIGPNGNNGEDTADGVLTGTVLVENPNNQHYRIQGAMRLVDKERHGRLGSDYLQEPICQKCIVEFCRQHSEETLFVLNSVEDSIGPEGLLAGQSPSNDKRACRWPVVTFGLFTGHREIHRAYSLGDHFLT